jgi:hypothetical protein
MPVTLRLSLAILAFLACLPTVGCNKDAPIPIPRVDDEIGGALDTVQPKIENGEDESGKHTPGLKDECGGILCVTLKPQPRIPTRTLCQFEGTDPPPGSEVARNSTVVILTGTLPCNISRKYEKDYRDITGKYAGTMNRSGSSNAHQLNIDIQITPDRNPAGYKMADIGGWVTVDSHSYEIQTEPGYIRNDNTFRILIDDAANPTVTDTVNGEEIKIAPVRLDGSMVSPGKLGGTWYAIRDGDSNVRSASGTWEARIQTPVPPTPSPSS